MKKYLPHLFWTGGLAIQALSIFFGPGVPYQDYTPELRAIEREQMLQEKFFLNIGVLVFATGIFWLLARLFKRHLSFKSNSSTTPRFSAVVSKGACDRKPLAMTYQLVLQFRGDSLENFDAIVALEKELVEELGQSATVDGHDVGSGETNIFIITTDPRATFAVVQPVLERKQQLQSVKAAYREIKGERYTVIWPERSMSEFNVA